jgi:hypothetical protein
MGRLCADHGEQDGAVYEVEYVLNRSVRNGWIEGRGIYHLPAEILFRINSQPKSRERN